MSRRLRATQLVVSAAAFQLLAAPMVWANPAKLDNHLNPEGITPTPGQTVQLMRDVPSSEIEPVSQPTAQPTVQPTMTGDLSTKSDSELTALTARWGNLNPSERRRLLGEVRKRMAATRTRARATLPTGVVVQREYGRVVRKSDGSVIVQRRVVKMRAPVNGTSQSEPAKTGRRVTFGIGFEQRSQARAPRGEGVINPVAPQTQQRIQLPPVITVNKQQTQPHVP